MVLLSLNSGLVRGLCAVALITVCACGPEGDEADASAGEVRDRRDAQVESDLRPESATRAGDDAATNTDGEVAATNTDGEVAVDEADASEPTTTDAGSWRDVPVGPARAAREVCKQAWAIVPTAGRSGATVRSVAVDAQGNIAVLGTLNTTQVIGGRELTVPPNTTATFVAKLDAQCTPLWARAFVPRAVADKPVVREPYALGFDASQNLVLVTWSASIESGGRGSYADKRFLITQLAPDATLLFENSYALGDPLATSASVSATGEVLLSTRLWYGFDFGDGSLGDDTKGNNAIATFAADGTYQRAQQLGVSDSSLAWSMALGSAGELLVAAPWYDTAQSCFDATIGPPATLAQVTRDGHVAWQLELAPSDTNTDGLLLASASDGSIGLFANGASGPTRSPGANIARYEGAKTVRWQVPVVGSTRQANVTQIVASPGRTGLLLMLDATLQIGNTAIETKGTAPVLVQLDEVGAVRWSAALHAQKEVAQIATCPDDALVSVGASEDGTLSIRKWAL